MSDWDYRRKVKRSKSYNPLGNKAPETWYHSTCVECGHNYMTEEPPENIPGAMSAEGFRCKRCRGDYKKPAPSPPPASVQRIVDEIFKTKK